MISQSQSFILPKLLELEVSKSSVQVLAVAELVAAVHPVLHSGCIAGSVAF